MHRESGDMTVITAMDSATAESLYHVRRKGSATQWHLLFKPWIAGIMHRESGDMTVITVMDSAIAESLYHILNQICNGMLADL